MVRWIEHLNATLADRLVRGRVVWFLLGLALFAAAGAYLFGYRPLKYNRSMEGFFPKSDSRLQLYLQNKEWFGGEATLLVVYSDPELWTPAGMKRQVQLAGALGSVPGVATTNCLAWSPAPKQPLARIGDLIIKNPASADDLRRQVQATSIYQGVFVAADQQTTALVVQLQSQFASQEDVWACLIAVRNTATDALYDAVAGGEVTPPRTAGTLLMINDVYEYTERDGRLLEIVSVLLMGAVIAISFRSLRWVLLPLLVIYAALYWSESIWALTRGELTMVSSAISSLVAVIGVSTVVHYGMHYRELRRAHDRLTAMRQALVDLNPAIFWVLLTTAGGFAALLICELKPVLDFAWLMLIATMLVGVAILAFLPLAILGFRRREQLFTTGEALMGKALVGSLDWVKRHSWLTMVLLIVPAVLVSLGMLRLQPQTDFTGNFKRHTELFQAYDYIETKMGGTGQLDLVFDAPDLAAMNDKELRAYLDRLRKLEEALSQMPKVRAEDGVEVPGITKVLGLADFVEFFNSSVTASGLPGADLLFPLTERLKVLRGQTENTRNKLKSLALLDRKTAQLLERQIAGFENHPIAPHFWNPTAGKMRLTLQVRERLSSKAKQQLIADVKQKAVEVLGPEVNPQTTGIYVMLTHLITSLLDDQNRTFALSLLCMFVMGVLAFRSFWLAAINMIPTVLPVVAVVGTMGWVGLPVNIATAMLASVAMGMTIDNGILYIYRFQQERKAGADFDTALRRTHGTTGIALVIANAALILGFGVLVLSRFIPLVHFGILTALALLGGLVGNLVLLPLLLHLVPSLREPSAPAPKQPTPVEVGVESGSPPGSGSG